ncbi:MAG: tape measure protein [Methylovulum miyakonense]|uniref:tape measure protein n=1 Tax=Methylovulum miyakonense TaxID=645578 RepID=UPI003BB61B76
MSDLRVRLILDSENNASGGVRELRNDARDLDGQMGLLEQRFNQFIAFKIGEVAFQWADALVKTADTYQTLEAKLERVTDSYSEQMTVQRDLFDISQEALVKLTLAEDTYIKNADAIKRMGGITEQALQVTETLAKAIASTSQGVSQDTAALNQWSQALGKGILNGDELNSIMENSLGLTQAIADGMGIPIGKLKELGEQGKLTGTDLVNALIDQKEHVDEIFKAVPITVDQGTTAMVNAWTKYIGESDKALGATQALAEGLVEVSKKLPDIVEGTLLLAGIYGVKLTAGLTAYIDRQLVAHAASVAAVAAAEREAVANLELLRVETEVTAMRVRAARAIYEEERYQRALAVTAQEAAIAQERLAAATRNVAVAEEAAVAASLAYRNARGPEFLLIESESATARLAAARATEQQARAQLALATTSAETTIAQQQLAIAMNAVRAAEIEATAATTAYREALAASTVQTTGAATAAGLLSKAVNGLFFAWIAYEGLNFANDHWEWVRLQFVDLAKDFAEMEAVVLHFTSGDFLNENSQSLEQKLSEINGYFDDIRHDATDAARVEAEQAKHRSDTEKKLLETQQIARKEALKELQSQLKETSAQIDAEYTRQTNSIKVALEQRKNAVMASALPEIQKETAVSNAIAEANAARLVNIQQAADKKLELIGRVYDKELARLKAGTVEQKAVEKQSIEERIALYASLEKNYQGIIDGLISEEQRHAQAAANLLTERENLELDTQNAIRTIRQAGMTDEEVLADKKKQLDENLALQRKALAEGDTDNARKYGEAAAKLAQELATQAESAYKAGTGYSSDADKFIKKFEEARNGISAAIDAERAAHVSQQTQLADSIAETQSKLEAAKGTLTELTATLREKFLLQIDVNASDVDAVIERIKQPTESWHTIHVVEDRSRTVVRSGNSFSDAPSADIPEGHQDGGYIQAFADGGFPRVTGQLPGYGGGDRVRALLEDGEFVLRKEAVAANGTRVIQALNDGALRLAPIPRFMSGGAVGDSGDSDAMTAELLKLKEERDQASINEILNNPTYYGINQIGNVSARTAIKKAEQRLRDMGRLELLPQVAKILEKSLSPQADDGEVWQRQADRVKVLRNHLFDKPSAETAPTDVPSVDVASVSSKSELMPNLGSLLDMPDRPSLTPNVPELKNGLVATTGRPANVGGKTVTLRFESPDGKQAVSGQFGESDARAMLDILKTAGMRTTGGAF